MKNLILLTFILAGLNAFAENSKQDNVDFNCPDNYVKVPALEGYTTNDFCVMKYEAKNDGSNNAISQASGLPYVLINHADSIAKCTNLGEGYDLITNDERQSIARNLELVSDNWATGVVGNPGGLSRGHSDKSPYGALQASSDDTEGCFGTEQYCSNSVWNSQRRTHTFSNGEVIWDIAGNVEEWVKDTNELRYGPSVPIYRVTSDSHPTSNSLSHGTRTSRNAKDQFGPSGSYSTDNKPVKFIRKFGLSGQYASLTDSPYEGLGYGYLKGRHGVIWRGGRWFSETKAGVFAVNLYASPMSEYTFLGFRCVFHP